MSTTAFKSNVKLNPEIINRAKSQLRGAIDKVARHRVTVGIHEDEGAADKIGYDGKATSETLVDVALKHEFGLGKLPERSWLRTWVDSNEPRLRQEMTDVMESEFKGNHSAIGKQSQDWANELRDWIAQQQGGLERLTEGTVKRKEAAGLASPETPLLATGQLIKAIKAKVDGGVA